MQHLLFYYVSCVLSGLLPSPFGGGVRGLFGGADPVRQHTLPVKLFQSFDRELVPDDFFSVFTCKTLWSML